MRKITLVLAMLSLPAFAAGDKIECIGPEPEHAKSFFVFLHGAGLEGVHRRNLKVLREIAEKKKVRFAIPIAKWQCTSPDYKGRPCWMVGPFTDLTHRPALNSVEEAAESCFRNRDYGILGFSNGAAFVNSVMLHCVPNKFTKLISVGYGVRPRPDDRPGLRGCKPQLNMLAGKSDKYYPEIKKGFDVLKNKEADVTMTEFEGGHELLFDSVDHFFD